MKTLFYRRNGPFWDPENPDNSAPHLVLILRKVSGNQEMETVSC